MSSNEVYALSRLESSLPEICSYLAFLAGSNAPGDASDPRGSLIARG